MYLENFHQMKQNKFKFHMHRLKSQLLQAQ